MCLFGSSGVEGHAAIRGLTSCGLPCRYQEAHDRSIRAKELADRLRAAEINRDLAEARESQQAARLRAQAEMANIEAAEFARVLAENKKAEQIRLVQVSFTCLPCFLWDRNQGTLRFSETLACALAILWWYFQVVLCREQARPQLLAPTPHSAGQGLWNFDLMLTASNCNCIQGCPVARCCWHDQQACCLLQHRHVNFV